MILKYLIILTSLFGILKCDVFEGYTLFTETDPIDGYYITRLIDNDYNIINSWQSPSKPASMAYLLPDSTLLYPCRQSNVVMNQVSAYGGRIIKYDWDGNVIWDWECNQDYQLHHDIEPLPNGNILAIAIEEITNDIKPDVVLEISPVGFDGAEIVWEWHTWDHRGSDSPYKFDEEAPYHKSDWNHFNAIHINNNLDKIYLSSRAWSEFYIIELGGNSDILYRWGNPQNYGRGTAADQILDANHGVNEIASGFPGENNVLIFNNKTNATGGNNLYSSVIEIVPPLDENGDYFIDDVEAFGPTEIQWEYYDDFHAPRQSGAFRLQNGNTLITVSTDAHIFEVTNTGQVVWEYPEESEDGFMNSTTINRSQKYGLNYLNILGDLNNDSSVNILDVVQLVNFILSSNPYNPNLDLNDDGEINVLDIVFIINLILS